MLNRFVIPTRRLVELEDYDELFSDDAPFTFSVLGSGGDDSASFLERLSDDISDITAFHKQHGERVRVEAMEVRWPGGLLDTGEDGLLSFLDDVYGRFKAAPDPLLSGDFELYLELPLDDRMPMRLPLIVSSLAQHQGISVAHKIRCGGDRPEDHPDPHVVAPVLAALRDAGVPFKATAGLHHPVRHFNEEAGAHMLGFLNVFVAAILAAHRDLPVETIRAILEDEQAGSFEFGSESLSWNEHSVPLDDIANFRRFVTTFGSCSFDEPREDLRALGLFD